MSEREVDAWSSWRKGELKKRSISLNGKMARGLSRKAEKRRIAETVLEKTGNQGTIAGRRRAASRRGSATRAQRRLLVEKRSTGANG